MQVKYISKREGEAMSSLNVLAPAKLNLSIDVLDRRPDGYHTVEMVMQTLGLCDAISLIGRNDGIIQVVCDDPAVPSDHRNLAHKAANQLKQAAGRSDLGATITIKKNIPVAAGLGGGSADAAAALRGLNDLWRLGLGMDKLLEIGLAIGADIPFCLLGGTALAEGIGEILTPLPAPPPFWVTLLKPNLRISTAQVYNDYEPVHVSQRPDTELLISALAAGDRHSFSRAMANVLESVTITGFPTLGLIKQRARELGALAVQMTGSGPTIFALTAEYRTAANIYHAATPWVEFACITTFRGGSLA